MDAPVSGSPNFIRVSHSISSKWYDFMYFSSPLSLSSTCVERSIFAISIGRFYIEAAQTGACVLYLWVCFFLTTDIITPDMGFSTPQHYCSEHMFPGDVCDTQPNIWLEAKCDYSTDYTFHVLIQHIVPSTYMYRNMTLPKLLLLFPWELKGIIYFLIYTFIYV